MAVIIAGTSVTANATSLYIVGNVSGTGYEWGTSLGEEMTETSTDVFEITTTINGWFAFVTGDGINSSSDWTTFNANRYGPATSNTEPTLGEATTICYGYDTSFHLSTSGEYYVVVDLTAMTVTITAVESELPTTMYIIGDVGSCAWSATNGVEMTASDGVYTATCTIDDNGGDGISSLSYVAFASALGSSDDSDDGWGTTNANRYGAITYNYVPAPGVSATITKSDSYSYGVAPGEYSIEVDLNNNTVTFTPTGEIDYDYPDVLYFIGDVDGASWDTTTESSAISVSEDTDTPGKYTAEITVGADAWFCIAAAVTEETDWDTFDAFRYVPSGDATLTEGGSSDIVMNGDASFNIATAGTYNCTIQLTSMSTGTITLSAVVTGIEKVDGSEAAQPSVSDGIYTLSGVKISSDIENITCPAGVYIVNTGGIPHKVIVK